MRLYGAPKDAFFAHVVSRVRDVLARPYVRASQAAHRRLDTLFSRIVSLPDSVEALSLPIQEGMGSTSADAKMARAIFDAVLAKYGIHGWNISCGGKERRQHFVVNAHQRIIYIPDDEALAARKSPLTELGIRALAEHEIGVHVRRSCEAEKQPLMLLRIGLAGYLRGEEGLASYVQQKIEGGSEYSGFDRYLAASLAIGIDGVPRDFRSVYSIMRDYYVLTLSDTEARVSSACEAAWQTCMRIFRGSTGEGAGTILTRDIVYLEGNIGIHNLLKKTPHVYDSLFIGKFDPLNSSHVSALTGLGILPSEAVVGNETHLVTA